MDLSNITVNTQSSIRIAGSKVLYFDVIGMKEEPHDADVIFLTHEHFDHFEPVSMGKVKNEETVLAAPVSMKKKVLSESGFLEEYCRFYEPRTEHQLDTLMIRTVPAYNKLKPFHTKGKNWQGYLVKMDGISYYVAGDTDVNPDMEEVQCDVALIPVGGHFTMDKKQAAEYILKMKPKAVIPTHYGSGVGSAADGMDFKAYIEERDAGIQVELKL